MFRALRNLIGRVGRGATRSLRSLRPVTAHVLRAGRVHASYDAASDSDEMRNYWLHADGLDADSANSKGVRDRLTRRARYEAANNGYADGMLQTHANYVVGLGPTLRVQQADREFKNEVETRWYEWATAVQFRRKLWCMCHAKTQDGSGFGIVRSNPAIVPEISLDWVLFETEQCTTPSLPIAVEGYVDGIRFDAYGNPLWYDVLKYHPGGSWFVVDPTPEHVPAKYVQHWFQLRRPGQHRAVPEFRSTLNVGANGRRFREATVGAAETAADFAACIYTENAPNEAPEVTAMSTAEIQKRMMTTLPGGYRLEQLEGKHPNATYESFHRQLVNEQGRPKQMPYGMAACDSADYNFASGKLDRQPYYAGVLIERDDAELLVVEPLFAMWFRRAALAYGWTYRFGADPARPPLHAWDWPALPEGDERSVADANDTKLKNGTKTHRQIFAEQGRDYDEVVAEMASDYAVPEEEIRARLLNTILPAGEIGSAIDSAPSAEFGGLSRLQWSRNIKAIRDVLQRLIDGEYSQLAAQTMLESLGLSGEKSQALVADALDNHSIDDPALQPTTGGPHG